MLAAARQTTSGKEFSPCLIGAGAPPALTGDFDFDTLLRDAVCRELADPAADHQPIDDAASFPGAECVANDALDHTHDDIFGSTRDDAFDLTRDDLFDPALDGTFDPGCDGAFNPTFGSAPGSTRDAMHAALGGGEPSNTPSAPARQYPRQPPPRAAPTSAKAWRAARDKRRKKEKDVRRRDARTQGARADARGFLSRHLSSSAPEQTEYEAASMPHASTGYQGLRGDGVPKRLWTAQECVDELGHVIKEWDGKTPIPILDRKGRIFGVCAGSPSDAGWGAVHQEAAELIRAASRECRFPKGCNAHRRGDFPALAKGVSFGGGQKVSSNVPHRLPADAREQQPGNLVHSELNGSALTKLLSSRPIRRIAGFASTAADAFAFWCPRLCHHYRVTLGKLFHRYPLLQRNFQHSIFPCATVNFGPRTCCFPHRDTNNLPYGLCAITALGSFNSKLGGHLILWDLKVVIEFPPGSTILIPSATLYHSNTSIQQGELRYSFTQYAAGGLFRWVEHGFQTELVRTAGWSREQQEQDKANGARRWEEGVNLFSTLDELRGMRGRK
ncbi:hypothetical protein HWV62_19295 [Athelia sp. TMB]|nr:hypothetical protein HWV62_19295 [Athelia sp. TMB]